MVYLVRSVVKSDQISAFIGEFMSARRFAAAHAVTEDFATTFQGALEKLVSFAGAKEVDEGEITITEFKAKYASVLNRTDRGSLKVIKRNSRRYVILDEDQVLALTQHAHTSPAASSLLADLPLPSAGEGAPRSRLPASGLVRLGRLPAP